MESELLNLLEELGEGEMNKTSIEWVKNPDGTQGYTWNPITGCLNGCEYCYARKLANGRLKSRYLANKNLSPDYMAIKNAYDREYREPFLNPFYPRFWEDRMGDLDKIPFLHKPIGCFVCDMSDLFGIGVPEEWTRRVLSAIEEQLMREQIDRFYLLTKQPQNLIKWSPFPDNCWVGVSATDYQMFSDACKYLMDIKATVKYISFEPLLGLEYGTPNIQYWIFTADINWVIIGAQTKPYKPPKMEWVDEIILACQKANIPVFLKDNLRPIYKPWVDWSFNMRQEMPR